MNHYLKLRLIVCILMLKIYISKVDLLDQNVWVATQNVLSALVDTSQQSVSLGGAVTPNDNVVLRVKSGASSAGVRERSNRSTFQMTPRGEEVDRWLMLLKPRQRLFVMTLREKKEMTLHDVAISLNIQPSGKDIKKHVNGMVGSILRWSKERYINEIAQLPNGIEPRSIQFLPPWYCEDGVYRWKERVK